MDPKETKRRRRERNIIFVTIVIILSLTYIESHISNTETVIPLSNQILIFGLININVILIVLLVFLIGRNVVKLVFERRHGILGSKLRTKLVAAFVSLSLVPTIVLFLVSIKFLSYSIDNWFNIKIGNALNLSIEVAQTYYEQSAEDAKYFAKLISTEITEKELDDPENLVEVKALLERQLKSLKVGSIELYLDNSIERLFVKDTDIPDIPAFKFSPQMLEDIFMGKEFSTVQSIGMEEMIAGLSPLYSKDTPREVIGAIIVSYYIGKGFVNKMGIILKTSEEYKQLNLLKNPIKFSYIITLFIVTLLIIFSATWFGLFLAKGITGPIQDLAEGTHEISHGNLDYRINLLADDEIGVLVNSFNQMTEDLKKNSEDLKLVNADLEQRRKYMETVLRNVSAGVISIDENGIISTINRAAEKMLGIKTRKVINKKYYRVLKPDHLPLVNDILNTLKDSRVNFVEKQIGLTVKNRLVTVIVSITILRDDDNEYMGMVAVFEDITHIQKAERVAAWREVAKRIAHEIKNPLTPVKLCAERLQKRYGDKIGGEDSNVFSECTNTIIDQVDVLKNLVNEFSLFARMPVTTLAPNELNSVIQNSIILFQDAHKDMIFDFQKDTSIPTLNIDAEQIKRVMVNLLDNAVTAIAATNGKGKIEIITSYIEKFQKARVEVKDNGPGVTPEVKVKLFEPYFSTKRSGTGLGLTIVNSIISDHNGSVRVKDNKPTGTVISFELPVV